MRAELTERARNLNPETRQRPARERERQRARERERVGAWICGSIIKGQRLEFDKIKALSIDTWQGNSAPAGGVQGV